MHSLRHTLGTHTVKCGTRLRVVQEIFGYASLTTTSALCLASAVGHGPAAARVHLMGDDNIKQSRLPCYVILGVQLMP